MDGGVYTRGSKNKKFPLVTWNCITEGSGSLYACAHPGQMTAHDTCKAPYGFLLAHTKHLLLVVLILGLEI